MFEMFSRDRAPRMTPEMFRFIQITSLLCTAVRSVSSRLQMWNQQTHNILVCVYYYRTWKCTHEHKTHKLIAHARARSTETSTTRMPKRRQHRHASIERDGHNWCGRQSGVDVNVTTCFWCIYCGYMFCGWPPSHRDAAAHTTYTNISTLRRKSNRKCIWTSMVVY